MVTIADVMTPNPITVMPDDSLRVARDRMAEGDFRRLPVVQSGRLVGIISNRDMRRVMNSPFALRERWYDDVILDQLKVWGVMTANPITVDVDASLVVAARLMRDHKIGGLPVVSKDYAQNEECLVGIITETDLLEYLIRLLGDYER